MSSGAVWRVSSHPVSLKCLGLDLDSVTHILNSLFIPQFLYLWNGKHRSNIGLQTIFWSLGSASCRVRASSHGPEPAMAPPISISWPAHLLSPCFSGSLRAWLMVAAISISGHAEMIPGNAGLSWPVIASVVQMGTEGLLTWVLAVLPKASLTPLLPDQDTPWQAEQISA